MTDNLLTSSTQSAPSVEPVSLPDKPLPKGATPEAEHKEDDSSAIQCICNFPKDNGTTIFCEICKTWQHITCYYPGREAEALQPEFKHSCAECEPRELDRHDAFRRMEKWVRENAPHVGGAPHDKKSKKPLPKTHKKKTKPIDLQLNGHSTGTDTLKHASPHEQPLAKKTKTAHKSSPSVSTHARKRSPSHSAPKLNHHGHPLSPATTPPDLPLDFDTNAFAPQFVARYEGPLDFEAVDTNTDEKLDVTYRMSQWSRPGGRQFWDDTHCDFNEVVQRKKPSPPSRPLRVVETELPVSNDMVLHLPRLITPSALDEGVPLIELNGVVGLQKDYCENCDNRYKELSAPLPFVFFPERIPLYIDARKIGSNARHVRRSCRRNARIVTYFLDELSSWRFWLVSDRPIAAREEITLGWDFSLPQPNQSRMLRLLGLGDEESNEGSVADVVAEIDHSDYDILSQFIKGLMAEYGECACNRGDDCVFVQFRRRYLEKFQSRHNGQKRKRAKSKPHATISPTSTGQATNSRAASEGQLDDVPENDSISTANSSRSKPPSRDMTPARLGSFDTLGILTEPTNRDKRKVQIAEDLFQKSAQEEHQPPRKKKKTAVDGATNPAASKSKGRNSIGHAAEKPSEADDHRHIDRGTSVSKATSPVSAVSPADANSPTNAARRQSSVVSTSRLSISSSSSNYRDNGVQTTSKLVGGATWLLAPSMEKSPDSSPRSSPRPRRPRRVISLTMRLMSQKRTDSLLAEQKSATVAELDSPATTKSSQGSPASSHQLIPLSSPASVAADVDADADADVDAVMSDAPTTMPDPEETGATPANEAELPASPIKADSPDLRLQMPPPLTTFASPPPATVVTTPMSASGSITMSPSSNSNLPSPFAPPAVNGVAVAPSPIKKKMSLSEYKNKANKAAASARPSMDSPHPLKTASCLVETLKSDLNVDHDKDTEKLPAEPSTKDASAGLPAA